MSSLLLFIIKLSHSLIVMYLFICLFVIWNFALSGLYHKWLGLAMASIALEAVIWFGNGGRCPLTDWALALGDETGADLLTEIFMIRSTNYVTAYILFVSIGLMLTGKRLWHNRQPVVDG